MTDRFRERLSEYLDGELEADEARWVERHLETCAACARTLEDLAAVVRRARGLPARTPPRDLWAGIETGIEAGIEAGIETGIEARIAPPGRRGRRVALSVPQLAAAVVLVASLGAGGHWILAGGSPGAGRTDLAGSGGSSGVTLAGGVPGDARAARYGEAIAELERALFDPANDLPPGTAARIRRALATIDRAIEDARRALAITPGDRYLRAHMDATLRRKADFLRQAVELSRS